VEGATFEAPSQKESGPKERFTARSGRCGVTLAMCPSGSPVLAGTALSRPRISRDEVSRLRRGEPDVTRAATARGP